MSGESAKNTEKLGDMDKQTLLAVLQFLKKNNLKDTEALLRSEANVTDSDATSSPATTASDVSQALSAYKREGDPTLYEDYYTDLKAFVEKSLDVHKCELSMVLYPIFVHMYLELVYNCHEDQARIFYDKFAQDQEEYYQEDLKTLYTVTKPEHMKGNQLLENFKASKFVIRMSRDSHNHLRRHLQENKQNLLLNIVQEHLFVDVFDGTPRNRQQIDATAGGMIGEARKEANKSKVYYGLLKEPEINIPLDDEEEPEQEEGKPKKKKAKKELLMKKAKNDPHAPSTTRIPLPEMRDVDKLEKAKCLRESVKRIPVGASNLPSVCFYTFLNSNQSVTSVDVCEDSSLMAAGFADSQIKSWSLTPSRLRTLKPPNDLSSIDKEADDVLERMMDDRSGADSRLLLGHAGPVYSTSFSPDHSYIISASEDATVRLWSTNTWSNLVCYKGHNYPVWDVKFSPHGHYFASGGMDRTVRLWSTDHFQPLRIFSGHIADVDCVQFHPNSNYIATGSADRTIRLWDVLNGNCSRIMTGHKGPIQTLTFSPDGKYLASAGVDKNIHIWELAHGELVAQCKGHTDTIYSLAFSREGNVLASGGLDNTLRLWDMGRILEDLESEGGPLVNLPEPPQHQIQVLKTKSTPIMHLHFTRRNLLLASGPYVS